MLIHAGLFAAATLLPPALQRPCIESEVSPAIGTSSAFTATGDVHVAVDGDRAMVVGTRASSGPMVVVFERGAQGWAQVELIDIPTSSAVAGRVIISLEGDRAVVGIDDSIGPASLDPEVWVLERVAGSWSRIESLPLPPGSTRFSFIARPLIAGINVIVPDELNERAVVYSRLAGTWSVTQIIDSAFVGGTRPNRFGAIVRATPTRLLVTSRTAPVHYALYARPTETALWSLVDEGDLPLYFRAELVALGQDTAVFARESLLDFATFDVSAGVGLVPGQRLFTSQISPSTGIVFRMRELALRDGMFVAWGVWNNANIVEMFAAGRRDPVIDQWLWDGVVDITSTPAMGERDFSFDGRTLALANPRNGSVALFAAEAVAPVRDCDGDCLDDTEEIAANPLLDRNGNGRLDPCELVGTRYCSPAVVNSLGVPGRLELIGAAIEDSTSLMGVASQLPVGTVAILVAGGQPDFVPNAGGSSGALCVGGPQFGRFAGNVQVVDTLGVAAFDIDPNVVPAGGGFTILNAGETWFFQAWFRDGATSNLTDAVAVTIE